MRKQVTLSSQGLEPIDWSKRTRINDAVTLLKRIRKFSMAQDIRARVAVHIFNKISFTTTKRVTARGLILNGMSDSLFDVYHNVETFKELWDTLEAKYMAKDASIVNMVKHNNSSMYNDNKGKRKHHDTKADPNKKPKVTCWKCGKPRHLKRDWKIRNIGKKASGSGTKGSGDGSTNPLKGQNMFNKSLQIYYVTYVFEAYFVQDDDVAWWVNSGVTVHVCKDRYWFKTYESLNDGSILHMGNELTALVQGRGCVDLRFSFRKVVSLLNVLQVPNIRKNLVSSSILNNCGYKQVIESNKFVLSKHDVFTSFDYLSNHIFRLNIISDNIGSAFMSTFKLNDSILWHARLGHVHFKRMQDMSKDGLIPALDMDTEKCKTCMLTKITKKLFQNVKRKTKVLELIHSDLHATPSFGNKKYVVTFIDDASRGIEGIFVRYVEHSKAFRFYVIELDVSVAINSIIESRDDIFDEHRFSSVLRPSQRSLKDGIKDFGGSVVSEKVIEEMDVKTAFLNRELEEEVYMNQPLGFIMPGNENKVCKLIKSFSGGPYKEIFVIKVLYEGHGEADVILGIRIKHESNVSTPLNTYEKLMPNKGPGVSQLEYYRVIGCLIYSMTYTMSDIAFVVGKLSRYTSNPAAGKEAEWLKKLLLEIPLWVKPISPISIRYDSVATLAKAYNQMYNEKSRHLGVRHSMIRELITNGVVSIEFVRSQQNLADHLTKGLARDLVIKSAERMGLKMCLEPAEKEDEVAKFLMINFFEKVLSKSMNKEEPPMLINSSRAFNVESDLIESMPNHDSSIIISLKIDSLFDEFVGELTLLKSIPPGIDETDCHPEKEIRLAKRLLDDNSSPLTPEEIVSDNSHADIESFSPSPIPIKDSDYNMEEIDLPFTPNDPMPPGIEDDDYDSGRDISILEELLDNYSLSPPNNESYHFDIPSPSRPPAKPPDGNKGTSNIKMMGDISELKVSMPNLMITRVLNQEESPDLLSHLGLENFQPSAECPMMINGKNIPLLDVPLFHFCPFLIKPSMGGIRSSSVT
nr:zinc finger, CCHC-type [Tanacetum cinerariifolium]